MANIYIKNSISKNTDNDDKEESKKDISSNRGSLSLSSYLDTIGKVISTYCASSAWVRCELIRSSLNNGNMYLEIGDTDKNNKKIRSQTAIIFQSKYYEIMNKFMNQTGEKLQNGMSLLILLSPKFSPQFGLSFIVNDIDPNFTIGVQEAKFKKIKKDMDDRGWSNLNKSKILPKYFGKVAVLSPENAAGLGDFKSEADRIEYHGLCEFDYYSAKFEGENVEFSITSTLKKIFDDGVDKYDALVFIRGGGSTSSLQALNEFKIVAYIARFPIPVICGIGHERDHVLIDDFAKLSMDTPSKVIEYIYGINTGLISSIDSGISFIFQGMEKILKDGEINLNKNMSEIMNYSANFLDRRLLSLQSSYAFIKDSSIDILLEKEGKLNRFMNSIYEYSNELMNSSLAKLEFNVDFIYNSMDNFLSNKYDILSLNHSFIEDNSYLKILNKGYSIIRDQNNKIVNKKIDIKDLESFNIIFSDGKLTIKKWESDCGKQ